MTDGHVPSSSLVETVAGFTAGVISTLAVHPLDIIKTRLQVNRHLSSRLGSSVRVVRSIAQNEGGITAFYRGLTPNIVGNSVSWALYFFWYSNLKKGLHVVYGGSQRELSALDYFASSGTAGIITAALTNPIWVIKTRMLSTGARTPGAYSSILSGIQQIYRSEGLAGFYRGLVPSLFGVSHGALQFMAYEELKRYRALGRLPGFTPITEGNPNGNGSSKGLSNMDFLLLSGLSKVFAGCATYPYQVIRARLQTYDAATNYTGVRDAIRKIWLREGLVGFYKGLGPNLLRVLPSTWVTFLVYENAKVYLPGIVNRGGSN